MIQFDGQTIHHNSASGIGKQWSIPELLDAYNPFGEEPLAGQNELFRQVVYAAEELYSDLSEAARLRYDFWKHLLPGRIESRRFSYSITIADTYKWEVEINPEGLYYKDLSGQYGHRGTVTPQGLADFWFCGPLMPVPEPETRKWLIALIRNAFIQVGGKAYDGHFPLIRYPSLMTPLEWTSGDYVSGAFSIMRDYGAEYGAQNFHDGLVFLCFLSFEQCLTRPEFAAGRLGRDALEEILRRLKEVPGGGSSGPEEDAPGSDRSRQLYMDNGGQVNYIYRDGHYDEYRATPAQEATWKAELIETYKARLRVETSETVLKGLIETLSYHKDPAAEQILLERAVHASPRDRQAIAAALWDACKSEKAVELLLELLNAEGGGDYWRNYVVNSLFRRQESRVARSWVLRQLQGDDPWSFGKAVDVLRMWGIQGDKDLAGNAWLQHLTWPNRESGAAAFGDILGRLQRKFTAS